ncbi:substrate-binding domain-containing protein [Sorangium sp. So ce1389]|uniref:substrate-binding domain-containing protein n=1 Tax=Sorangium sp. So ce1389 TaxID=3133336 RepID=UPI003F608418
MTRLGRCRATAASLALMTAACGSSDSSDGEGQLGSIKRAPTPAGEFTPVELEAVVDRLVIEINKNAGEPMQMVILLKRLGDFFAPIATGASRAMGELGATGNVIGQVQNNGDVTPPHEVQNRQIEQAVADGAEGLGVSPFGEGNATALDDAVAKGVHVVTFDTDVAVSKRSLYVGTLNERAGVTAGETLLPMLPQPPGTVVIHGTSGVGWYDGYVRTQAAKEVLEAAGYQAIVSEVVFVQDGEAWDVDWMKSQMVSADPPVVGMLGLFNLSYRCVLAADAAGMPDLPIVAFDFDPKTVEYMRQKRIKATHVQRQYYEGYLVPYILYGINSIGLDATRAILAPRMAGDGQVDIGVDVVPADKVDAYNAFLDAIGSEQ